MSVYIVRHGQTDTNKRKLLLGRADPPLNEEGEKQAVQLRDFFLAEGIRFDRVISSPLKRAVRTAETACSGDNAIETDDRLLEMDAGPYEGCPLSDLPPEMTEFFRDFVNNPAPQGMETLASVEERTGRLVDSLTPEDGNVLISTHAIAMKGILEHLDPDSRGSWWSRFVGNCSVFKAEFTGRKLEKAEEIFCAEKRE